MSNVYNVSMSTLFIMSGLPFSGKSTLSKKISQSLGIKRISFDEVWVDSEKLNNFVPTWENITQKCEDIVADELKNNRSVIYDNLGDKPNNRDKMQQLALANNADFKIIYINISKEEVLKRRQENLLTQSRHQVSDFNFNTALDSFSPPTPSENPTIFTPNLNVEEWVLKSIK